MLGFLSVLAIGFAGLLLVAKNGVLDARAAAPSAATAAVVPSAAAPGPGGPQIEQLVPPAVTPPALGEKPRAPGHPIKLARSPSPSHVAATTTAKADVPAKAEPAAPVDDSAPAKKPADKPAAGDDDQVVHIHHTTASDDDDDDDN
jgi:hypothetical protein